MDDSQTVATIADKVRRGECILFLGAGVHAPPPEGSNYSYPETERPLLGRALAEHLAEKSNFTERYPGESANNLQRVAFAFELHEAHNRKSLVDEIQAMVDTDKAPSPVLRALARLDFPLVMTTNYDSLFEAALYRAGKTPTVAAYDKNRFALAATPTTYSAKYPFLYKIHGDIRERESVVVTDEDYIDFVLRMSDREPYNPVPDTFMFFFKRWPILFLGYRLIDYNLRLLFKTLRWNVDTANIPKSFAVDPFPDFLIVKIYSEQQSFVTFIVKDVWSFVPDLYQRVTGEEMPK